MTPFTATLHMVASRFWGRRTPRISSAKGVPLSGEDMAGRLKATGFVDPEVRRVIPEYTALVTAKKPQTD
jgi:hypothetical protein